MLRFGLALALAVLILDQASKAVAMALLPAPGSQWTVSGFFNLVHVRNTGVSFGMLPSLGPWVLSGVAAAIAVVLGIWLARADKRLTAGALGLAIGGAVGNVVDRLRHGAVFDFLDFHAFGYHWPAFNLADAAITAGVAGLLFGSLFEARKPRAAASGRDK